MTTYADMPELERCQMLAEFCGYEILEFSTPFAPQNAHKKQLLASFDKLLDGFINEWNPFKDANALEEVRWKLRDTGLLSIDYNFQGFVEVSFHLFTKGELSSEPICGSHQTNEADALAQVVAVLVERKEQDG